MKEGSFIFAGKWLEAVRQLPETGMGYTVVTITLTDGRVFEQVVIDSGRLIRIRGRADIPFREDDIAAMDATHDKWNWRDEP